MHEIKRCPYVFKESHLDHEKSAESRSKAAVGHARMGPVSEARRKGLPLEVLLEVPEHRSFKQIQGQ